MSNPFREAQDTTAGCQIPPLADLYWVLFGDRRDGVFVEVGAFDGYQWLNSQMLIALGWHGLLLEPHPRFYQRCVARWHDNDRVKVLRYAAGCYNGPGILYLGGSGTTLEQETVLTYNDIDWARANALSLDNWVEVQVRRLDDILAQEKISAGFEVLSVDVEGAEMAVLAGLDLRRWRPRMVIVETHAHYPDRRLNYKAEAVGWFMENAGYRTLYANTINTVYEAGG